MYGVRAYTAVRLSVQRAPHRDPLVVHDRHDTWQRDRPFALAEIAWSG